MPSYGIRTCAVGAAVLALSQAGTTLAQYPVRPIRLVIGFPPGGTTDVIARVVGQELSERLGKPVVIDNRAGASGTVGTGIVAKSPADGYTLVLVASTHGTAPFLYKSLPYDTDKDLAPIGLIGTTPYVLVVHPGLPAANFGAFLDLLRQSPGKYSYASGGAGSGQHLSGELLKRMTGVNIVHVAYRGSGGSLPDVIGGRVPIIFENVTVVTPLVRKGLLRAIAGTGSRRSSLMPEIPTVSESGLPGFEVVGWFGVLAPTGVPADVVKLLNAELNGIIAKPGVVQRFQGLGAEPLTGTPADLGAFLKAEQDKWGRVIREAGISLE